MENVSHLQSAEDMMGWVLPTASALMKVSVYVNLFGQKGLASLNKMSPGSNLSFSSPSQDTWESLCLVSLCRAEEARWWDAIKAGTEPFTEGRGESEVSEFWTTVTVFQRENVKTGTFTSQKHKLHERLFYEPTNNLTTTITTSSHSDCQGFYSLVFRVRVNLCFVLCSYLFLSLCLAVPEQRMHSLLCLQRHRQTDPAEPQEPRGTVQRLTQSDRLSFTLWSI